MGNRLAFSIEYATEWQAMEAAFTLGDAFEDDDHVESWHATLHATSPAHGDTVLTGWVEIFFADEEVLRATAHRLSEVTMELDGFVTGRVRAIETETA